MNRSTALRGQVLFLTFGSSGRSDGLKAQWFVVSGFCSPAWRNCGTANAQRQNWTNTVTNKLPDKVWRVTPCAPIRKLCADSGAHGSTRSTRTPNQSELEAE